MSTLSIKSKDYIRIYYKKSEEYRQKLEALQDDPDTEKVHAVADGILCELLRDLGYGEVVDAYEQLDMWYA